MRSVIFSVLLSIIFCTAFVSSHQAFYYSSQNSVNYHPPYDFTLTPNQPLCSSSVCNATQVPIANPNYTIPASLGICTNTPAFMANSAFNFDPCCTTYEQCFQQCGFSKNYCDQQLYACMWYQCGVSYRLRPGDRFQCRSYATCYASYMANSTDCDAYNTIQAKSCTCIPRSDNSLASEEIPNNNVTKKSVEERQASPSPNPSGTSSQLPLLTLSPSPSPIVGLVAASTQSNSAQPDSSESVVDEWGTYVLRPIPQWDDIQGRCPPYFGNYVSVMSDQEFDDINYFYSTAGGSALKVWWKLF